jgi:hypothetical protein
MNRHASPAARVNSSSTRFDFGVRATTIAA